MIFGIMAAISPVSRVIFQGRLPAVVRSFLNLFVKQEPKRVQAICAEDREWIVIANADKAIAKISEVANYQRLMPSGIPKNFFSDIERCLHPDQFTINGDLLPAKMDPETALKWLSKRLKNPEDLKIWSQMWNYGLKIWLAEKIRESFGINDPKLLFTSSILSLDDNNCTIICEIEGIVTEGTHRENLDLVSLNYTFSGRLKIDLIKDSFEFTTDVAAKS